MSKFKEYLEAHKEVEKIKNNLKKEIENNPKKWPGEFMPSEDTTIVEALFGEDWEEDVNDICRGIFNHISKHFEEANEYPKDHAKIFNIVVKRYKKNWIK